MKSLTVCHYVLLAMARHIVGQLDTAGFSNWPDHFKRLRDRLSDQHWFNRERQSSRFDACDVQHFVNQTKKMTSTLENVLDAFPSARGKPAAHLENLRKAQDGIQG